MRDWREVGCFHLGRLILDKFEILSSTDLVLVLGEVLSSVICGAEAVHQHEGQILALLTILPLHQHHLLGNKVQKCIVAFDRQQRFGLVEPHPSARPPFSFTTTALESNFGSSSTCSSSYFVTFSAGLISASGIVVAAPATSLV